jgi:hypothetical protein
VGRFTNKIVVITGGTSGIGLAAARQFIKEAAIPPDSFDFRQGRRRMPDKVIATRLFSHSTYEATLLSRMIASHRP